MNIAQCVREYILYNVLLTIKKYLFIVLKFYSMFLSFLKYIFSLFYVTYKVVFNNHIIHACLFIFLRRSRQQKQRGIRVQILTESFWLYTTDEFYAELLQLYSLYAA